MNSRSRFIGAAAVVSSIILCVTALLFFVTYKKQYFDWNMQGVWVTSDGCVEGEEWISVRGYVVDTDDRYDEVHMKFQFPGGGQYLDGNSETGDISYSQWNYDVTWFGCSSASFNSGSGYAIWTLYALDLDKEYVMFQWNDGSGRYLVAATDPDAYALDIVDHFRLFFENNAFN